MVRIFAHANYDFIGFRRKAILATIALFVVGMIALAVRGVNYSVEFTGGTLMRVIVTPVARSRSTTLRAGARGRQDRTTPRSRRSGPQRFMIRGTVVGQRSGQHRASPRRR